MGDNHGSLPRTNISMTASERDRLEQLARLLGGVPTSRAVALAVANTLAMLRAREPLWVKDLEQEPPRDEDEEDQPES